MGPSGRGAEGSATLIARAKINLDLHVLGRRADGRHDLDSLVAFAELGDSLAITPSSQFELVLEGPFAPALTADDDNLVWRAAHALAAATGRRPDVRIVLEKKLPTAAGIGGGSADAAATLRGLQALWGESLDRQALHRLAIELGADVPVCLAQSPCRMEGIGERLTAIQVPALAVILVNPRIAVPTGQVFANRRPDEGGDRTADFPPPVAPAAFVRWLAAGRNDLEAAAIRQAPAIAQALEALRELPGCALARMSGSGATCFGLFPTRRAAAAGAMRLATRFPGWWIQPSMLARP